MMKTKAAKTAAGEIFKSNSFCVLCVLLRPFNFGVRGKNSVKMHPHQKHPQFWCGFASQSWVWLA